MSTHTSPKSTPDWSATRKHTILSIGLFELSPNSRRIVTVSRYLGLFACNSSDGRRHVLHSKR
jgi:hypothetical protein